jgi:hypothetical protein
MYKIVLKDMLFPVAVKLDGYKSSARIKHMGGVDKRDYFTLDFKCSQEEENKKRGYYSYSDYLE